LPVWDFKWDGAHVEKRILMPYRQNSVHVIYRLLASPPTALLRLTPAVHFRGYEDRVDTARNSPSQTPYRISTAGGLHCITAEGGEELPPLRLFICNGNGVPIETSFVSDARVTSEYLYPVEESRGYEFRGT